MSQIDDFFRHRIDHLIDLRHPLAVLSSRMPCRKSRSRWRTSSRVRSERVSRWKTLVYLVQRQKVAFNTGDVALINAFPPPQVQLLS